MHIGYACGWGHFQYLGLTQLSALGAIIGLIGILPPWASVSARVRTVAISSFTIRPTGIPVQSAMMVATACSSTLDGTGEYHRRKPSRREQRSQDLIDDRFFDVPSSLQ